MTNSNVLYLRLMREAQQEKVQITNKLIAELQNIYSSSAKQIINKAKKGTFNEAWYKDYSKYLNYKVKTLNKEIETLTKKGITQSSLVAASVDKDFFEYIGGKYSLEIEKEIYENLLHVPDDVLMTIINGNFYKDNRSLSERIWNYSKKNINDIQKILLDGMAEKKPLAQLMNELDSYVNPKVSKATKVKAITDTYGRVDYNSMRLVRTSINHAFYNTNITKWKQNPYAQGIQWRLSTAHSDRMHGHSDICDEYANHNEGLGKGVFAFKNIPGAPHPNCLCTQSCYFDKTLDEIATDLNKWIKGASNPKLDKFILT